MPKEVEIGVHGYKGNASGCWSVKESMRLRSGGSRSFFYERGQKQPKTLLTHLP
ncbi:hypothetical protein BN8_00178 [Fibrisoma limi BUZ 3]|uniref:Uncharacterized protein n=1 Tax=Fibrisoma limi BUZ 3 TaxID=1185876 RepID=I2GBI7_9BACT|nr:hypothetical protein BN8_00178 [Fibrisoma limi BUZ 3]